MTYVDHPEKRQKHPHYEHRTIKLDRKDNDFTSKKFHKVRKVSTHKKLLKSLGRIGMCLNERDTSSIPVGDLDKVCFILINDYDDDDDYDLGVGPLNDGYLTGLKHHRFGFKVFYLYNPKSSQYISFLGFFVKYTQVALTVFYTGRDDNRSAIHGIQFNDGSISSTDVGNTIAENCNGKCKGIFITDTTGGGSVFDINAFCNNGNITSNFISFYIRKTVAPDSKEGKRSHGIFTYYFSKFTSECPNITPKRLAERMNASLRRFEEMMTYEVTDVKTSEEPLFK